MTKTELLKKLEDQFMETTGRLFVPTNVDLKEGSVTVGIEAFGDSESGKGAQAVFFQAMSDAATLAVATFGHENHKLDNLNLAVGNAAVEGSFVVRANVVGLVQNVFIVDTVAISEAGAPVAQGRAVLRVVEPKADQSKWMAGAMWESKIGNVFIN